MRMLKNKIVSADEAVAIIRDGDTVCISGFVGIGTPDELILALERRFLEARQPVGSDARVRGGAGRRQGARAQPPRARRPGQARRRRSLVAWCRSSASSRSTNAIEAYNLPLGVHLASLSRHRRARPRHRSRRWGCAPSSIRACGGGKLNARHDRRPGRADARSMARSGCATKPSRSTSR